MSSSFSHLEAAAADNNVEVLEKHRKIASELAMTLSDYLFAQANATDETNHWYQQLRKLTTNSQREVAETLVMVVGGMGAGKSSAINALLGESGLLPTSGYDACTSVATEVRYNHSADPDQAYRAEITFITREELLGELHVLRDDVLSAAGGGAAGAAAEGTTPDDSSADIAWAKIQAIWPRLARAEIAAPGFDLDQLLRDPSVHAILGQTRQICHPAVKGLCKELKRYIANRDNVSRAKRAEAADVEQQFWPLVDKVSVFIKADVLSTGAVIRDMPGGQDGNSARSARAAADGHKCDHLCVFVPIERAISEQIVKKPFNDASTFKNWISFDGRLDGITYVCTKTDAGIEIDRDAEEFGLEEDLEESKRLEEGLHTRGAVLAETRKQLETIHVNASAPAELVAPRNTPVGAKRRRSSTSQLHCDKRLRSDLLPSSSLEKSHTTRYDLRRGDDSEEILVFDIETTEAKELATKIQCLETRCETLQRQVIQKQLSLQESCIQARNTLTRSAIQRDFVLAAKELLSRKKQSSPGATKQGFGVDAEVDFDLNPPTVHTVSATGYFKSLKRLSEAEFWAPDTTELSGIPAWRNHVKQLTVPARRRKCQAFLKAILKCFNQISIWCDDGSGVSLTSQQVQHELTRYKADLDRCAERLVSHFEVFIDECRRIFDWRLSERIKASLPKIIASAIEVARKWPSRTRGDRLLPSGSFKAACRKQGVYKGQGRAIKNPWDLNAELAQPLIDEIDHYRQRAFARDLPAAFRNLKVQSAQAIYDLSDDAEQRLGPNMTESARQKLRDHMRTQKDSIHSEVEELHQGLVSADSGEKIRRQISDALKREMKDTWKSCAETTGEGSFRRQQDRVERHLRESGAEMYTRVSYKVEDIMWNRCGDMRATLDDLKGSVYRDMWHAYTTTIVAKDNGTLAVREGVRKRLAEADGLFKLSS
ncbi:hypothetical protein Daus18300_001143 [Diaporthe australafricana]|uniref:Tat pathway signal sequence n=1 Tax=Diaporthe australafricana TaxID=127596 RepID=A0ABR3Y050_9PEZI